MLLINAKVICEASSFISTKFMNEAKDPFNSKQAFKGISNTLFATNLLERVARRASKLLK